jgi:chromosome segregation ATPase
LSSYEQQIHELTIRL